MWQFIHEAKLLVASAYSYEVFGLRVRSEPPLPELSEGAYDADPDVTITQGKVPESRESAGLHAFAGGLLLVIPAIASYWIAAGNQIIVEAAPDAADQNIRLYLLGSAMGALLHQRGLLPLHANAVEIGGKAVAFMGPSGSGKSTLAAWFHDHGHRVIADDVCVVRFNERGRALASGGLPRLRLWRDSLEASGRVAAEYRRSYAGDDAWEKYDVPLERSSSGNFELAAAYVLGRADRMEICWLSRAEALEALIANTYRGAVVGTIGAARVHWENCLELAQSTPLFTIGRSRGFEHMHEEAEAMLVHAKDFA